MKQIKFDKNGKVVKNEIVSTPPWAKKINEKVLTDGTQDEALKTLYETLDAGYIEGFGYCSKGLISPKITDDKRVNPDECGGHASIAVGKGFIEQKDLPKDSKEGCYILVKNSYGKNWPKGAADSPTRFSKGNNMSAIFDKDRPGYYWVHEQDFVNHTMMTTQISRDKP